jgi:hypothetical protein
LFKYSQSDVGGKYAQGDELWLTRKSVVWLSSGGELKSEELFDEEFDLEKNNGCIAPMSELRPNGQFAPVWGWVSAGTFVGKVNLATGRLHIVRRCEPQYRVFWSANLKWLVWVTAGVDSVILHRVELGWEGERHAVAQHRFSVGANRDPYVDIVFVSEAGCVAFVIGFTSQNPSSSLLGIYQHSFDSERFSKYDIDVRGRSIHTLVEAGTLSEDHQETCFLTVPVDTWDPTSGYRLYRCDMRIGRASYCGIIKERIHCLTFAAKARIPWEKNAVELHETKNLEHISVVVGVSPGSNQYPVQRWEIATIRAGSSLRTRCLDKFAFWIVHQGCDQHEIEKQIPEDCVSLLDGFVESRKLRAQFPSIETANS